MNLKDVAVWLGVPVPRVRRWIGQGLLSPHGAGVQGRGYRFSTEDLLRAAFASELWRAGLRMDHLRAAFAGISGLVDFTRIAKGLSTLRGK